MKTALVTGASSGIGREISIMLLKNNYKIYGIGRNFNKIQSIKDKNFIEIICDISNIDELKKIKNHIKNRDKIDILVNSAGIGEFKPLEEMSIESIIKIINTNLLAPTILTNLFLRDLKNNRGYIFNITSIEAIKHSKFSAIYSASKAGLRSFGLSLFEEVRKSGVKVVTINPDITKTNFFDNLNFKEGKNPLSYIEPSCIAEAIENILNLRDGTLITEITVRTQILQIQKRKVI